MGKWTTELPGREKRGFARWPLLLEYSAWTMTSGLLVGAIAAKAELDYGGSRVIDDPWYPSTLIVIFGILLPLTIILPTAVVNVARIYWPKWFRRAEGSTIGDNRNSQSGIRTDGWTWVFDCLIAATLAGLCQAALPVIGKGHADWLTIFTFGTRGFVWALLPMALVLARKFVMMTWRAWRDRGIVKKTMELR